MEAELKLDVSLQVAAPLVLLCLLAAAYLSAAETAIRANDKTTVLFMELSFGDSL